MSKSNNGGVPITQKKNKKGVKKQMNIIEQHQKAKQESKEIQPFMVHPVSPTEIRNRCKFR